LGVQAQRVRTDALAPEDAVDAETAERFAEARTDSYVVGAAHLRVGHHWRLVGIELGAMMTSGATDGSGVSILPQGELTLGPRDVFYVLGGAGVSQLTSIRRHDYPYFGLGIPLGESSVEARFSISQSWQPAQLRGDLFWTVPINPVWSLRAGLAFGRVEDWTREASLGCILHL
ncbi:MAG TPA: hypothetical protein VLC09_15945, partial [Polyangiaceae bacterium]|nr:hypothetical protein [Polyangiaceae bacterium]